MPARARTSGAAPVSSLPLNRIWPARGLSRPIMLLSSVLLPTPLRPIRQTSSFGPTSRSMSRRTTDSPYATDQFWICNSVIFVPVLTQVDFDHLRVALYLVHRALAQRLAFVQHGHAVRDLADEGHVVIDDDQRVLAGHRQQQLAGSLRLARRHPRDGLVDQEELRVLGHQHAEFE